MWQKFWWFFKRPLSKVPAKHQIVHCKYIQFTFSWKYIMIFLCVPLFIYRVEIHLSYALQSFICTIGFATVGLKHLHLYSLSIFVCSYHMHCVHSCVCVHVCLCVCVCLIWVLVMWGDPRKTLAVSSFQHVERFLELNLILP